MGKIIHHKVYARQRTISTAGMLSICSCSSMMGIKAGGSKLKAGGSKPEPRLMHYTLRGHMAHTLQQALQGVSEVPCSMPPPLHSSLASTT